MADVRLNRPAYVPPAGVPGVSEDRPRQERREGSDRRDEDRRPRDGGREELAVAFDDPGRSLAAQFEQGPEGEPQVRIIDRKTGGTVAMVTPEELRAMAEQTGLPSGLLFQART